MKEITILAPNNVGSLAKIAEALGGIGVNIEAISAYENGEKAVFRVLTNDSTSALKAISKLVDFSAKDADILIVDLPNRPGELGKLTRKLANHKIDLESVYIVGKKSDFTEVALKPSIDHLDKAKELLGIK